MYPFGRPEYVFSQFVNTSCHSNTIVQVFMRFDMGK